MFPLNAVEYIRHHSWDSRELHVLFCFRFLQSKIVNFFFYYLNELHFLIYLNFTRNFTCSVLVWLTGHLVLVSCLLVTCDFAPILLTSLSCVDYSLNTIIQDLMQIHKLMVRLLCQKSHLIIVKNEFTYPHRRRKCKKWQKCKVAAGWHQTHLNVSKLLLTPKMLYRNICPMQTAADPERGINISDVCVVFFGVHCLMFVLFLSNGQHVIAYFYFKRMATTEKGVSTVRSTVGTETYPTVNFRSVRLVELGCKCAAIYTPFFVDQALGLLPGLRLNVLMLWF